LSKEFGAGLPRYGAVVLLGRTCSAGLIHHFALARVTWS